MLPSNRPSLHNGSPRDWAGFVSSLRKLDQYWEERSKHHFSVFGERNSWMSTIDAGHGCVCNENWADISTEERNIFLGFDDQFGVWGLLGSMRAAGNARRIFNPLRPESVQVREQLRNMVAPLVAASTLDGARVEAFNAVQQMCEINGIGIGVATRLLSLARPDVCISINGGSAPCLVKALGQPFTINNIYRVDRYAEVLSWIDRQAWYSGSRPSADSEDVAAWEMRAALVDAFAYEPS